MKLFENLFRKISPHKKIIFIVEDNHLYALALQGFLSIRFPNLEIKIFADGESCLASLHLNPFIIIMDYLLNTEHKDAATGLATIKQIKLGNPHANIILLSAKTELDVFIKALSVYGCIYIRKDDGPFEKIEHYINNTTLNQFHSAIPYGISEQK